jgi:pimeloyl-ACP methyl ester carboxylesterase
MLAALAGLLAAGCATTRHGARVNFPRAPLDPEIAKLPGVRGYWMPESVYGGKLYVIVAGPGKGAAPEAPPLFLVHGLGDAGARDFYPVLSELAQKRQVVTFDLPGFSRSVRANLKYEPDRYAAVVAEVIDAFADGRPADVMGHSMGGAIALLHAGSYPTQVRRLVLVDVAGVLHREALVASHLRRATDPAGRFFPRLADMAQEAADTVVDSTRALEMAPELIMELGLLRKGVLRGEPGRIAALGLILHNFGPAMDHVRAPTLLVWGADDHIAPLRTGQLLSDRVAGSQLVVLAGVGHNPMHDAPARLLAEVERHLGAAGAPAAPPAPAAAPTQGEGLCREQADVVFSGVYDTVTLDGCVRATLDGVRARRLVIRHGSATVVRSSFAEGIVAEDAELIVTGGQVGGEIAVDLDGSKADLAGVSIAATREPYRLLGASRALFSVCPVQTAGGRTYLHGFFGG